MIDNLNSLINKYIREKDKENLWNLAFKYQNKINLERIANYFINEKDSYYLCELISIVAEFLDLDNIFDKIIDTNDDNFIFLISKNGAIQNIIDSKYFLKLNKYFEN